MSWDSKVLWTEGLFLQPHHFQQSDRYAEGLISGLARRLAPYLWGVNELEIDDEVLKVGQFAIKGAAGLTADGAVFRSSRIRALLQDGDVERAAALLGRPWEIEGVVSHGDKRGRTIGFPTMNVYLGDLVRPALGVYTVRANIEGESDWLRGVANLGRRPTVGGEDERLEVHLFDFDQDVYDKRVRVQLLRFIRPERKFESFDALKAQIAADADTARGHHRQA